jgi:menaquinone-dependent protoporphyrinogen oxidase
MTVLVTAASKHGATREIAEAIARVLTQHDVSAEMLDIDEVGDLERFEGVVLGSAVYMGHWLEPARKFVERRGSDLARRKTWLFSSGPVGEAPHMPKEARDVCDVEDILATTNAVEHRLFSGKLDKSELGFPERAFVRAVGAQDGDYRDWAEIEAWARGIAAQIRQTSSRPPSAAGI